MTDFELGWVVAMLEGEGAFCTRTRSTWQECRIEVCSTDQSTTDKLLKIVGGKVYGPYNTKGIPCRKWCLQTRPEIKALLEQVIPHLGPRRRQQATKCLEIASLPSRRGWPKGKRRAKLFVA